jgi:hypothetical protein
LSKTSFKPLDILAPDRTPRLPRETRLNDGESSRTRTVSVDRFVPRALRFSQIVQSASVLLRPGNARSEPAASKVGHRNASQEDNGAMSMSEPFLPQHGRDDETIPAAEPGGDGAPRPESLEEPDVITGADEVDTVEHQPRRDPPFRTPHPGDRLKPEQLADDLGE